MKNSKTGDLNLKEKIMIRVKRKLVRLFAPEIIQLVKRKTNFYRKKQEQNLSDFPRYIKTIAKIDNHEIIIPDSASFLFMHREIFMQKIYQFKTTNTRPYIIDGGANIGLATIYLKLLYPSSRIIAFEPDFEIFSILKNNIHSYNFRDVELVQKGLWNNNTTLSFASEGADGGLITDIDKTVTATEAIEVVSLKPYLQNQVDFLKLDIEGSETIVLKDIQDDLVRVDRIFVEYHSFVDQPQTLNEIIDILTKAKFRLYMSIPGNNSLNSPLMGLGNYNNIDFQLNIFGYKEGK
nr:FkbM family methyltransferase [uncultured Flavobacterium sp.]